MILNLNVHPFDSEWSNFTPNHRTGCSVYSTGYFYKGVLVRVSIRPGREGEGIQGTCEDGLGALSGGG